MSEQPMKISRQPYYELYVVDYVLSNGAMTLAFHGQGHSMQITEIENNDIFPRNNWIQFSVNSAVFLLTDSSRHFSKANT